jgi:hypothetical protein
MGKSKFSGPFLPFPRWVLSYLGKDTIAKVTLLTILLYMDSDTQEVTTSYNHVAKLTGYSRITIIRAVNRLISIGVLVRQHRYGKRGNISNLYVVNFNNPKVFEAKALVSPETLGGILPDTSGGIPPDTSPSIPPDTQSRIIKNKNNHNNNLSFKRRKQKQDEVIDGYSIDSDLLDNQ